MGETKPERTVRQRYADYRKTFPKRVNARRVALLDKMYSGFTEEESARTFADNPGWEAECERQEYANLTDAERAELSECERVVDEWQAASPWHKDQCEFVDAKEKELDELMARLKAEKGTADA